MHGIINRHARRDGTAGAVNIELDILLGVFTLEKEHLGYDQLCGSVRNLVTQENNAFLEEARKNVIGALSHSCLLYYIRDKICHAVPFLKANTRTGRNSGRLSRMPEFLSTLR